MIPIETEKEIRRLLGLGMSGRKISQRVVVCHGTIATIRRICDMVDGLTKKQREKIKTLLEIGLPVGAIEMRLRIPEGIILAVRRYYYLHMRCPTCGSLTNVQNITSRAKRLLEEVRKSE